MPTALMTRALKGQDGRVPPDPEVPPSVPSAGALEALGKKRGRPRPDPRDREIARPRTDNDRLRRRLHQAERIIEVQGKVSELLGISLDPVSDESESES